MSYPMIRCGRCGDIYPEDLHHPGHPGPHQCAELVAPIPMSTSGPGHEAISTLDAVIGLAPTVALAIEAALAKHGPLTHDRMRQFAILSEEFGEVAKDVLGTTHKTPYSTEEDLFRELIHVMAVCVMMVLSMGGELVPETPTTNTTRN